jgi:hypothetical protein
MMSRTYKDIREDCRDRAWRLGEERTRAREARRVSLDESQLTWEDGAWDAAHGADLSAMWRPVPSGVAA